MPALRIGAYALPDVEVRILKSIVNLISPPPDGRWQFVAGAPYDVLVIEGDAGVMRAEAPPAVARAVLRLRSGRAAEAPDTLHRPLRANLLRDWLAAREREWRTGARVDTPAAPAAEPGTRFRLRRWPPMLVLHNDPVRIRIATMLMRQPMGLADIVALSGQGAEICKRFLPVLDDAGVLQSATAAPTPAPGAAAPQTPARGLGGLLGSIRRRLGL